MMKYAYVTLGAAVACCFVSAEEEKKTQDIKYLSEAFGHLIGKNLEGMGVQFDVAHVIKGLQDAAAGREAPMTEAECVQAITEAHTRALEVKAAENLAQAELFLETNRTVDGVVSIGDGKVQYKIVTQGTGPVVEEHGSPVIRYEGRYVDGTVFTVSREDEVLSLDETIPGFTAGLLGMQEGERRIVYIHPDKAYGTHGYLPPNSFLELDIEVVKAQGVLAKSPLPDNIKAEVHAESSHPGEISEHLR